MEEKTYKSIKKSLHFEKSGETLSVEISLENVSPKLKKELKGYFNTIYSNALEEIAT